MDIAQVISGEMGVETARVQAVINLLDEGNTVPFIARYRKEVHGGLDDEQIRTVSARLESLRNLCEKKEQVLKSIESQGKLTPQLRLDIEMAVTQSQVDDLYLPYRPKRRTRAMIAREKGLDGLAAYILMQAADKPLENEAANYVSEDGAADISQALGGASDIIAENISETAAYRDYIRRLTRQKGSVLSRAKDEQAQSVYETYYNYSAQFLRVPGYAVLAMNRGEKEKFLTVSVETDEDGALKYMRKQVIVRDNPYTSPFLEAAIKDAFDRLMWPSLEREIRNELTDAAQGGAMLVFKKNLAQLLMQPPVRGQTVLGWDPGFRNGCKLAVVDPTGKILDTAVVYPTAPFNKIEETKRIVKRLVEKDKVNLISLGNGTASRESEGIIADMIKELFPNVSYVIVNEAGASVYSASEAATEELPEYSVAERGAASMARRLQDPLAELVKIDPKAIGVGQYQHDLNQKKLDETLSGVVEDCVNRVGVDLNTASASLLSHVSGVNKALARNIVAYRNENGAFSSRRQLLAVPKLGAKAYEQCAGFLRIPQAKNPLDSTAVHPESYELTLKLMNLLNMKAEDIGRSSPKLRGVDIKKLAGELGCGEMTLSDIIDELKKPGRDPRDEMEKPILRSDIMEMKDLTPGMVLKGTVRNVIDFGAFVDIGVHQDGLIHVSHMSKKRIKHPLEVVSLGDVVSVRVLNVDLQKKRIGLELVEKSKEHS